MQRITITLLLIQILFGASCHSNSFETESFVIENQILKKTFWYNCKNPGRISISVHDKSTGEELTPDKGAPYFEFVLNNRIISSNDPFWVFENHTRRNMENGGTEFTLFFKGVDKTVFGLQVIFQQQVFPGSTLMREKMILKTQENVFSLNKTDGHLHFRFPGYSLKNQKNKPVNLTEIRIAGWENKPITFGNKKDGNHMFYPKIIQERLEGNSLTVKGPVSIAVTGELSWFTAYEHASQDNLNGFFKKEKPGKGNLLNDALQGTTGVFKFSTNDEDLKFIGISTRNSEKKLDVTVDILRGGYLDGEIIDSKHPYETVWTATGFYHGDNIEIGKAMLRKYLLDQICEKPASRIPKYYYNTWGMQSEDRSSPYFFRGILTYERIFEEIEYAAELGVDIFVIDAGWEPAHGEWIAKESWTEGLKPIKEHLDKHGIVLGLWFSPMGIDPKTQRYKEHPEWVIKDSQNQPVKGQLGLPVFDFVSGFYDLFIDDCQKMIDEGCRYMKWDAINTFYSSLPDLHHGDSTCTADERRARYEYLLPVYVTKAMKTLTDYEPKLVIEIDLTEARRAMNGLAPLSQGKFFWMNNGASWYNDYSSFRAKSVRTIIREYAGIIPLELFTYANYPQNAAGFMKYNVHNSLLGGHGFWGNLQLMTPDQKKWVGTQVHLSKKILPSLSGISPQITGNVGDSPEIYTFIDEQKSAGQIIAFSEIPSRTLHTAKVNGDKVLAVINHSYMIKNNQLEIPFNFTEQESSEAVFILPNNNTRISISSSTSAITEAEIQNENLSYLVSQPGIQKIVWDKKYGIPAVSGTKEIEYERIENDTYFTVIINVKRDNTTVTIKNKKMTERIKSSQSGSEIIG